MKFAIPTYARYETLLKKTLFFLLRHKVDKKDIYLFIREDDKDLDCYKGLGCNVVITKPQLCGGAHNSITEYFDEGEYIIELDDDLQELMNEKREAIKDFVAECNLMKDKLDEHKCSYGGTYSVDNPFFMSKTDKFTTDLRYMLGCVRFRYIRKDIKVETNYSEDFEFCLKHFVRDGKIVKNNHLAPKTKIYSKGGNDASGRNFETEKLDKVKVNKMYPQYTRLFQRKNGRWDLRLKEYKQKKTTKKGQASAKQKQTLEHKFVVHLEQAEQRWEKFKDDPSVTKWTATGYDDVSEELDKKMISMWNLPRKDHLGKCGCFDSHYRLYQHIVKNKLNNVLLLEDDAVKVGDYPTDYPDDCITYIGGLIHKNKQTDNSIVDWVTHNKGINYPDGSFTMLMTMSYIIPKWEIAEALLTYLHSLQRWRCIDGLMWKSPIKKAYLYPAVVVEEETPSLLRTKKKKSNIHYQLVKWGQDYTKNILD